MVCAASETFTEFVCPETTTTLPCVCLSKPDFVTDIVYVPAATFTENVPSLPLVVDVTCGPLSEINAPAIGPALVSVTTPLTVPCDADCAITSVGMSAKATIARAKIRLAARRKAGLAECFKSELPS
jgi:hypothetical protein